MAGSLNKVTLIGNVGGDPEIRRTQDGRPIANLSVATSESWRDKNTGEKREKTEWHKVVVFNEGLAKVVEQYIFKGSRIYVEGKLQTRSWEKDGTKHYTTEIVLQGFGDQLIMLDRKEGGDGGGRREDRSGGDYGGRTGRSEGRQQTSQLNYSRDMDDDIPF